MKDGILETTIKIPIEIHYSVCPAEQSTMEYEGCPEHIVIDIVNWPANSKISDLIGKDAERIKKEIDEDLKE